MRPHSTLDPSFVASVKRLFNNCSFLDIDMTSRVDWRTRRSSSQSRSGSTTSFSSPSKSSKDRDGIPPKSFLDEPASVPPKAEVIVQCSELRYLLPEAPQGMFMFRARAAQRGRPVTIRDVLVHLDRFLYEEVPAAYWPEEPAAQDRIECAHRLRVRHLSRTHGRSLSGPGSNHRRRRTLSISLSPSSDSDSGARSSAGPNSALSPSTSTYSSASSTHSRQNSNGGVGLGVNYGTLPLPFMSVVSCEETDGYGRIVRRERKVAPRIDWLGGKFFFAGLKKCSGDAPADFELMMEGPWARRRK